MDTLIERDLIMVAEAGINHGGKLETALELISLAKWAGFDYVKFQKRDPLLYPEKPYNSPLLGQTTYRKHKQFLELSYQDYEAIDVYCKEIGIEWFASVFDKPSVDFMKVFNPPFWKLPSPAIFNKDLVRYVAEQGGKVIMSTGMSELPEVIRAVNILRAYGKHEGDWLYILHCCSEYKTPKEHVNLNYIPTLVKLFPYARVGYSSHDAGVPFSVGAVAKGAEMIEVHVTLDRTMKGSDHKASLEREEIERVVRHCQDTYIALGDGDVKHFYPEEKRIREKVMQTAGSK